MEQKGTGTTFLTPGRKAPCLKTTLTKPHNTFYENTSPLYIRSVSSCETPQLTGAFTSILSSGSAFKENRVIKSNVEPKAQQPVKVDGIERLKNSYRYERDVDVDNIEAQIVPETVFGTKDEEKLNVPTISDFASENDFISTVSALTTRKTREKRNSTAPGRQYTSSFCSSSGDESITTQSRSSVCDGCSVSTSNSLCSQPGVGDFFRVGSNGDCTDNGVHTLEMLDRDIDPKIEALLDEHLSFDRLESDLALKPQEASDNLQGSHKSPGPQLSLSSEQMMFLLLRMVLSRYKQLTESLATERKMSASQRKTLGCLIQAVILLSRRVRDTSDQCSMGQYKLQSIQREYAELRGNQRKIYVFMCVLLVCNLCNIQAVRTRIMKMVKFFGLVENARKINRFRKMVAENWRNIPSLLTDFWRIFIFRSSTRLKSSCE